MTDPQRCESFLALHQPGSPLLLANAWDVGSARLLSAGGFRALATAVAGARRLEDVALALLTMGARTTGSLNWFLRLVTCMWEPEARGSPDTLVTDQGLSRYVDDRTGRGVGIVWSAGGDIQQYHWHVSTPRQHGVIRQLTMEVVVERSRVQELHYITPIENLESICLYGLQSHNRAAHLPHSSVADEDVQGLRVGIRVPQGRALHDYVNLYFDARNPMMTRRRDKYPNLIVVRVDPAVLDFPGAVICDGNAASSYTRFLQSPDGLAELDEQLVYAEWWTDSDFFTYLERKRKRCCEVLVPEVVPPGNILGCYTFDKERSAICRRVADDLLIEVNRHVFL